MLTFVILVLVAFVPAIISYFYYKNKYRIVQRQIDDKYNAELAEIENEIGRAKNIKFLLQEERKELLEQNESLKIQCTNLIKESSELNSSLRLEEEQIDSRRKQYLQDSNMRMIKDLNSLHDAYEQEINQYKEEYYQTLEDSSNLYQSKIKQYEDQISQLKSDFNLIQLTIDMAIESNKIAELEKNQKDYYRLKISDEDVQEIKKIREISSYLRDKEALNKVVWKMYYEKPYQELVGRVVGQSVKTGIYKITNLDNGMCYVGQAANIAERWRQHIKRGLGAETPTQNKLYPAMYSIGVENFTFEILEECERSKLNDREDFWQKTYHAIDYGYSIK